MLKLQTTDRGYHEGIAGGIPPGTRYVYRLDEMKERPDPASLFQPEGVHNPSQVVDTSAFAWNDQQWQGKPLEAYIIYEVHVGAYSPAGTFDALLPYLAELKELGVTALELMPVAQFPGSRNWGYDGVHPFAVQNSYGGPEGLQRLVDACHAHGLAVVLDVVYNHLGPEGNYLNDFGPYFTGRYHSPWGDAVNFDGEQSDEVARFFLENALYWVRDFHIDALRLDAIHGIIDRNARPFLQLLGEAVGSFAQEAGRKIYLIAESDLNDVHYIEPVARGGYGLDAQWSDDFHHALHTLLTGESTGYYLDFGRLDQMAKALTEGYVYSGEYSAHRRCRHGNPSRQIPASRFVVCAQNHDQVGNRLLGERLRSLVSMEAAKVAAGMVILSPFIPLLFMGEEWGEKAPFQYFTSHSDRDLITAVRRGRREEFASFGWQGDPPDAQAESTFLACKLDHTLKQSGDHQTLRDFYRELIRLRKSLPALAQLSKEHLEVRCFEKERTLQIRRWYESNQVLVVVNFSDKPQSGLLAPGKWQKRLDSADRRWGGPGTSLPLSFDSASETSIRLSPESVLVWERMG
jgi:maltooligosyltrehalose trehalohydrolase